MTVPDNVRPIRPHPTPADQWRRTGEEWPPDDPGDQDDDDGGGRAA